MYKSAPLKFKPLAVSGVIKTGAAGVEFTISPAARSSISKTLDALGGLSF